MKKSCVKLPVMTLAIVSALVLLAGCFSYPAPATAPARQYATVTLKNVTGETIFYLYISERTESSWGQDWLGDNVLVNNDTYTTRLLTGQYDVKVTDLSQNTTWVFWIRVDAGGGTFSIEPSDRR